MLTFQDFADYYDLSVDEIQCILNGASVTDMETCAIVPSKMDAQLECRKIEEYLLLYREKVKNPCDQNRPH